jgi:Cu2+-exporting ATPase
MTKINSITYKLGEYSLIHKIDGRIRLRTPFLSKGLQDDWENSTGNGGCGFDE